MDTNFDFKKFYTKIKIFGIIYDEISIKAYQSIEKIEKYHAFIYYIYNIIYIKIKDIIPKNAIL